MPPAAKGRQGKDDRAQAADKAPDNGTEERRGAGVRGFGAGVIWGGGLGLFGLALASLMAPLPGESGPATTPSPQISGVTVPAGSEFSRPKPEASPVLPQTTTPPLSAPAPRVPAPQAASAAPAPQTGLPATPPAPSGAGSGPALADPVPPDVAPGLPRVTPQPGPLATPTAATGPVAPTEDAPPLRP
jgi:hypothetical protein